MVGDAVRLGLVGVGRWGRNYVRTIAGLDDARLVAVASRNPETATTAPPGCRIVEDWRTLVASDDVDGIIIATPPASHAEIMIAALRSGKPVLVEKPVTQSRSDAELVRTAFDRHPGIVLVEHTHLFHPAFRALRAELPTCGRVLSIRSSAGNLGPYRTVPVLWDWAAHDLAMCLTIVPGMARALRAVRLDSKSVEGGRAERLALDIELAGGIPAHILLSTMDDRHRWFAVDCETCTLVYRDTGPHYLVRFPPGADITTQTGTEIPVANEPPLTRAILTFVAAVRDRDFDRTSIDLGLAIVDLIADCDDLLMDN